MPIIMVIILFVLIYAVYSFNRLLSFFCSIMKVMYKCPRCYFPKEYGLSFLPIRKTVSCPFREGCRSVCGYWFLGWSPYQRSMLRYCRSPLICVICQNIFRIRGTYKQGHRQACLPARRARCRDAGQGWCSRWIDTIECGCRTLSSHDDKTLSACR